ncbi:hypothetical protein VK055_4675 [Klebsiella pneumoniae subsp. pneumoniae]|nr:hypothetical protein VK055_4675 [Klebsiella pneumoniae subsp. pneumoniae]
MLFKIDWRDIFFDFFSCDLSFNYFFLFKFYFILMFCVR